MKNQEFEMKEMAAKAKADAKKAYEAQLRLNYRVFESEVKLLRKQYTQLQNSFTTIERVMEKLKYKYYEQDYVWLELKRHLNNRDIRQVYRLLGVPIPADLKLMLETKGAVFWEKFAKAPTNRYDTRGICSQELGYIDTCLGVEPPTGGRRLTQ